MTDGKQLYARLNSFSMLTETKYKAETWRWSNIQAHYYDAPEVWTELERGKKKIEINYTYKRNKANDQKKNPNMFEFD